MPTDDWQPMAALTLDAHHARYINVRSVTTYRWLPYKPKSEQRRKGMMGRWQIATDYGWTNCAQPAGEWVENPPLKAHDSAEQAAD